MDRDWRDAAISGDCARLDAVLADGGDVNARDKFSQTALMLAARHGRADTVQRLIGAGADLDVTAKYGLSATMLAVVNHHDAIARSLACAGADLTLRGTGAAGFFGKTAADLAVGNGQPALAELLRQAETDSP
ncbi:MAG: ankyrin repeat domain-containing protein [Alphaproteobacteria bacterium]|nr:ankyrin repeat domain-containing protein [Alphaproteobacteria bacterium]